MLAGFVYRDHHFLIIRLAQHSVCIYIYIYPGKDLLIQSSVMLCTGQYEVRFEQKGKILFGVAYFGETFDTGKYIYIYICV